MSLKDTIKVDLDTLRASIDKCDPKGGRRLINDWLKENTPYPGGWEVTKDFRRQDDPERNHYTISNHILGLFYYRIEKEVEGSTFEEWSKNKDGNFSA